MTTVTQVLDKNRIDALKQGLGGVIAGYTRDPGSAEAEFHAATRVVRGFETESTSRDFTVTIDEPKELGGTNKGPNPVEVLLGSLGTCQQIVLVAYAAVLGIELDELRIDVNGTLDLRGLFNVADVPSGFKQIHFDTHLRARNTTPEQLAQLKSLALAHCPVLDTLQRPIPVTNHYEMESLPAPRAATA